MSDIVSKQEILEKLSQLLKDVLKIEIRSDDYLLDSSLGVQARDILYVTYLLFLEKKPNICKCPSIRFNTTLSDYSEFIARCFYGNG